MKWVKGREHCENGYRMVAMVAWLKISKFEPWTLRFALKKAGAIIFEAFILTICQAADKQNKQGVTFEISGSVETSWLLECQIRSLLQQFCCFVPNYCPAFYFCSFCTVRLSFQTLPMASGFVLTLLVNRVNLHQLLASRRSKSEWTEPKAILLSKSC